MKQMDNDIMNKKLQEFKVELITSTFKKRVFTCRCESEEHAIKEAYKTWKVRAILNVTINREDISILDNISENLEMVTSQIEEKRKKNLETENI